MATNDDYFYEVDRAALNRALKLVVSGSDAIDAQQVRATLNSADPVRLYRFSA
jgi:hypothetical protein